MIAFLERLAADDRTSPVLLEIRASTDGLVHLLGCEATEIHSLRRTLADLIPGTSLVGLGDYLRTTMRDTGTVKLIPTTLPLEISRGEVTTRAVYSALNRKYQSGETACLQVILGPGVAPTGTPKHIDDPREVTLWQALTRGNRQASSETRNRIRDKANQPGMQCTIRIGVTADTDKKRHRIGLDLLAGIRTMAGPDIKVKLERDDPTSFNLPRKPRWFASQLTTAELAPLTFWPTGNAELPGMPPAHPRLLRAADVVADGPLPVAASIAPGDQRHLGLSLQDAMMHLFALGPTGVGKTTMLEGIMLAAIKDGCGVLILDPKNQTPDALLPRILKERWKDIYEIDAGAEAPLGFNALDPGETDPDVWADSVLGVLEKIFHDPGPRSSDILNASVRTLIRTGTSERPNTIVDIPRLLTDAPYRRRLVAKVQDDLTLAGFWAWYESLKPQQQMNVINPLMSRLRKILLRPALVKILGQRKTSFHLPNLFKEQKIVVVPLNEALIGPMSANLLGGLIVAATWQATQARVAEPEHETRPGLVFVDEADRFMDGAFTVSLKDALARSRSASVGWVLSTQYWDQLPKDMKSAIKTNARSKAIFRLEDDDDARTIAKLAPELEPLDFMELGRHQVYIRLVANGITTSWALGKTYPPIEPAARLTEVRRVAAEHHAPGHPDHDDLGTIEAEPPPAPSVRERPRGEPPPAPITVGRRRRDST